MKIKLIFLLIALAIGSNLFPDEVLGGRLRNKVILDGMITDDREWSDTEYHDLDLKLGLDFSKKTPYLLGRIWVRNDDEWLYLLYRVERQPEPYHRWNGAQIAWYLGRYVPPWEDSDLATLSVTGKPWDACAWDDRQWYDDREKGGSMDVEGAVSHDGRYYWFEFRKALNAEDEWDVNLQARKLTSGVLVGFWDHTILREYHSRVSIRIY